MALDVANFLMKKYINTLSEIELKKPSRIPLEFGEIRDILENKRIFSPPEPDLIRWLYQLNDVLCEWRISTEQRNGMKQIFRYFSLINPTKVLLKDLKLKFDSYNFQEDSSIWFPSDPDRSTCFRQSDSCEILDFDKPEKKIVDWLNTASSSGKGFKMMGIHGMGSSGKTTLVHKVLQKWTHESSKRKILWVCLSDLTCKDEIDLKIIQHLLEVLDCDIDSLEAYGDDEEWLKQQVKKKLEGFESYVVVFDDVWLCNEWFTDLCQGLAEPKGGAVIVTSRIKEVAMQIVGGDQHKLIHLKPLYELNFKQYIYMITRDN